MKALVLSDIHVHNYKQFNREPFGRLKNTIKVIRYAFKLAEANGIQYILHSGDLFDQFGTISVVAVNEIVKCFKEMFEKYKIEWVSISGNHDYATKNTFDVPGITAQEFLTTLFHHYHLIDNFHYSLNGITICGIPYFENIGDFWQSVESFISINASKKYLMMHQTVWPDNEIVPDDLDYNDERLKSFDLILNGHIHHPLQVSEKFINVGTPLHRDAGDVGTDKGFWFLDLLTAEITFWETGNRYPQFIRLPYTVPANDWDEQQYILRYHTEETRTKKQDRFDLEKFTTDLKPEELVSNYCKDVKANKNITELGIKFVK